MGAGCWRSSWIYLQYKSCPKLPSWQQSWICSRTPLDNESLKRLIGKNVFRFRKFEIDHYEKLSKSSIFKMALDGPFDFDIILTLNWKFYIRNGFSIPGNP